MNSMLSKIIASALIAGGLFAPDAEAQAVPAGWCVAMKASLGPGQIPPAVAHHMIYSELQYPGSFIGVPLMPGPPGSINAEQPHPLDGGGPLPTVIIWQSPGYGQIEKHFEPLPGETHGEFRERIKTTMAVWFAYFPPWLP